MKIPDSLLSTGVADEPIEYKWTVEIKDRIATTDADTKPKLSSAVASMSVRAAFGFGIASAEWVIVRLSKHVNVDEPLQRIEAAWGATIDARYARFPMPRKPDKAADYRIAGPIYLAEAVLMDMHNLYVAGNAGVVYMDAVVLSMIAEHVCRKNAAFKKWTPDVLKRAAERYPKTDKSIAEQRPIARESFDTIDGSNEMSAEIAQAQLLASFDPTLNPYLVPEAELVQMGIERPYPGKA